MGLPIAKRRAGQRERRNGSWEHRPERDLKTAFGLLDPAGPEAENHTFLVRVWPRAPTPAAVSALSNSDAGMCREQMLR